VLRAPLRLYDWHAGWLLGHRFLRLTHLGRTSGRRYQTVVEVLTTDPIAGEVMVMAGFGRTTDWLRNIQAHPAVEITLGRQRFRPVHRILDEDDAAAVLADYEHHNRLITPIVRRVLSGLVGWTYDGGDDARHRLVRELPVIAFGRAPSSVSTVRHGQPCRRWGS
jgi:deazaflavin-dependent oxidoreductase (nitroreductase family)